MKAILIFIVFISALLIGCGDDRDEEYSGESIPLKVSEIERRVFEMVVSDVLNSKKKSILSSRTFYGRNTRSLVLKSCGSLIEWPENFNPNIHGWTIVKNETHAREDAALGLDLRYYGKPRDNDWVKSTDHCFVMEIIMYSAKNIGAIGAASLIYEIEVKNMIINFIKLSDA